MTIMKITKLDFIDPMNKYGSVTAKIKKTGLVIPCDHCDSFPILSLTVERTIKIECRCCGELIDGVFKLLRNK